MLRSLKLGALLIGIMFLREAKSWQAWAGGALIGIGSNLLTLQRRAEKRPENAVAPSP
jgi:uncharacterized membrane protein